VTFDTKAIASWAGDSQWRALQADWTRFRSHGYTAWSCEGFWALAIYRVQRILHSRRPAWLWIPARIVVGILSRLFNAYAQIHLSAYANIGPGTLIPHPGAIWINGLTTIGSGCTIFHGCTIGIGPLDGGATIGDDVFLSCNTCILGPVKIGDNALIAANSLVISNVPAGATAIGVPAKIVPKMWSSAQVSKASEAAR